MAESYTLWKSDAASRAYLDGVRGAIPLAQEQLELLLRVVDAARPNPATILDLGCGDGILGRTLLHRYPNAACTFLDFSPAMIEAARRKTERPDHAAFLVEDFAAPGWVEAVSDRAPFEVIVSGLAIHHQPDDRKKEIYREIFHLLAPGDLFLHLEHVSSPAPWIERLWDELFIDSLCAIHAQEPEAKSREEIAREYYYRPDKAANQLAPLEDQCDWLREIGFRDVDCFFKVFELALFGGVRPE